jgi:hypothetical protein
MEIEQCFEAECKILDKEKQRKNEILENDSPEIRKILKRKTLVKGELDKVIAYVL